MIAFLDTPSGISGDMFLGCLIDAGWPVARLKSIMAGLDIPPDRWAIRSEAVMRGPIAATLAHIEVVDEQVHRHLRDVRKIILTAAIPPTVQERAIAVFVRLAQAEAAVHGTTVDEVHFHEVGALDAIIDIVGVCAGLHDLGVTYLYASGLPLGEGWTNSAHGRIPLPAPATLALLADAGATTRRAPGPGELVTPTGAALLAELATFAQPPMRLTRIGIGAGQKEFDWPNIARLWLGETTSVEEAPEPFVQLETNIDDMNPELYPTVSERLLKAGALDVWTTAIGMKKGRPGVLLCVLARAEQEEALANLLLTETTTLGVRVHRLTRHEAARQSTTVQTGYGTVPVKVKLVDGVVYGAKPEYEACRQLAEEHGVPVRIVLETAHRAAQASSD